jgi:hypothetical protein
MTTAPADPRDAALRTTDADIAARVAALETDVRGLIFGENRGEAGGRAKIAMTTPVEMANAGSRVAVRFFLPRTLSRETAPQPADGRVRIVAVPSETVAALRFSGSTEDARVAERKAALLRMLRDSAWLPVGEPVFLGYDPPFTPPFLRRNEVAVPVRRR